MVRSLLSRADIRLLIGIPMMVLWLAGCEPAPGGEETSQQPAPSASDLVLASASVALPPPGTAPEDLPEPDSEGAQALVQYCTACHPLPSPATHSATDWPVVLRRMWLRTDGVIEDYDIPVPDTRERVLLLNYLLDYPLRVTTDELPAGAGRDLFVGACAQCHELPDPRQHSPSDWAAVVIRMRQYSVQMLRQSPPQREIQEIILYLERASG
jgi:cytochrome c5